MATYFSIGHYYYGVPHGLIGVLLASFLGWILARPMVETRGVFWEVVRPLLAGRPIFSFPAVGSITAGG